MPEGHTIHRAARLQRRRFAGSRLSLDSPQGRFSEGAAALDGRTLITIDAYGKHLFYRWEDGETLHVHLGLFGRFRMWTSDPPEPTDGTRLRWRADAGTLHLSGPTACELLDPDAEVAIRARLGPDPLAPTPDGPVRFARGLARRRAPVGQALLDQALIAGIGNVYRAEMLFLAGINPLRSAGDVTTAQADQLWSLAVTLLGIGERIGRIVTVDHARRGYRRPRDVPRGERLYVYRRHGEPCLVCGAQIERVALSGRTVWWCATCQPS